MVGFLYSLLYYHQKCKFGHAYTFIVSYVGLHCFTVAAASAMSWTTNEACCNRHWDPQLRNRKLFVSSSNVRFDNIVQVTSVIHSELFGGTFWQLGTLWSHYELTKTCVLCHGRRLFKPLWKSLLQSIHRSNTMVVSFQQWYVHGKWPKGVLLMKPTNKQQGI